MAVFPGKVFLLVTGASQGIGKEIAVTLGSSLEPESRVLLLARSTENLKRTAAQLPKHLNVVHRSVDLSNADANELNDIIKKSLENEAAEKFDRAVIIHNVGSVGNISQATIAMTDFNVWREYYDLNVFSPAILNSVFMKIFEERKVKKHVINITSLCAIKPMKSTGYYCSGKAAREMFFKVFAEENPGVDVLNYSPGPVETDMLQTMCNEIGDTDEKANFNSLRERNASLTTEQTVNRLVEVLAKKRYKSGDHIDYFDSVEQIN